MSQIYAIQILRDAQRSLDFSLFDLLMKQIRPDEAIVFSFHGHDHDSREVYEIPMIRLYAKELLDRYPQLLLYVNAEEQLPILLACIADVSFVKSSHTPQYSKAEYLKHYADGTLSKVHLHIRLSTEQANMLMSSCEQHIKTNPSMINRFASVSRILNYCT